ncbi:MAG TPA: transglycosylase SLT domain-containing protein [Candidatus Dormibacteraeota bacterium]|nr:transglycosylase SLT domain-containing protein [Candidatus Dormibacteraeota bacterium]
MSSIAATSLSQHGVAYAGAIAQAAREHGLAPALLAAVAAQETGGPGSNAGHNIVGDGGHGHGVFQIDDRYHAFARSAAAMDPAQNAEYAATMLSGLIHRYGSVHRALSAYNAGDPEATGSVTDWADGRRLGYADSVLRHEALIGGSAPESTGSLASQAQTVAPSALALMPFSPALPPAAHLRAFRDAAFFDAGDGDADDDLSTT